jgi:hypothetical protein
MYKTVIFVDSENLQQIDGKLVKTDAKIVVMVGFTQDALSIKLMKENI